MSERAITRLVDDDLLLQGTYGLHEIVPNLTPH
jgi:hypothetical protein